MKKKLFVTAAVFMLMFSFAGQAMAAFTSGDLIMVVYKTGGTGNEVAIDLGAFSASTPVSGTTLYNANTFALSQFTGSSWSDLNVAYFEKSSGGSPNFWLSGPTDGVQTNNGAIKSGLNTAMSQVLGAYSTAASGASMVTLASSSANSYWQSLNLSGTSVGQFATYVNQVSEKNLAALASTGYVDQYLYYYPKATNGTNGSGVAIADVRTFADGHTEISAVPIPAAIWLLGSGLIGLVGIRRRETAA